MQQKDYLMVNITGKHLRRFFIGIMGTISLIIAFLLISGPWASDLHSEVNRKLIVAKAGELESPIHVYLPLIQRGGYSLTMGVETHVPYKSDVMDKAQAANVSMMRYAGFSWKDIEPVRTNPPTYNWGTVNESGLLEMANKGFDIIGTVKYTPDWAQKYPGYSCGPINYQSLDEFAEFVGALVERYSAEPYNIKYWEFGNEPDVYRGEPNLPPDNIYGCWGEKDDPYYGGGYYAEMLKAAYPAVNNADQHSSVLLGGLLLDCDPTNNSDCISGKFFEGILKNSGANYFDIVSFHGYPSYYGKMDLDENDPKWASRGGVVLGKANFLREVMSRYGTKKPLMHTEGAFLCPDDKNPKCNPSYEYFNDYIHDFFEAQADYVIWLYIRNWAADIRSTIWYTIEGPGWRYAGMLDENQQPKPAYNVFQNMTSYLAGTWYVNKVTEYSDPDLRAFEFQDNDRKIWVIWSVDEENGSTIELPQNITAIYDKYGTTMGIPPSNQITIFSPIYIEMSK